MNAQLKPLDVQAVTRPTYDNTHASSFSWWSTDNDKALRAYYLDLGKPWPQDEDTLLAASAKAQRFICFCKCQWDRARGVFV